MASSYTTANATIEVIRYVGPTRSDGASRVRFLINAEPGKYRAPKAWQVDIALDELSELLTLLERARHVTDDADCPHVKFKPIRLHDAGGIMVDGVQCRACSLVWKGKGPR